MLVDVFAIAALFVLRSAAGAAAVEVRISPWLLLVTALLALFLALAKRRSELALTGSSRPVLEGYSLALVDQLIAVTVACTIAAYAIYTFTAHSPALMATIPFVVFGLFRYLLLVHRDDLGEEPENVLLERSADRRRGRRSGPSRRPPDSRGDSLTGLALLDAVDLGATARLELALHAREALVDAVPAGGDEVDEQRQVVHAGMPLGEEVVLEAFEAADRLAGQASHLGELPADRSRFGSDAFADGILDRPGSVVSSCAASSASASTCARARSSAASTSPWAVRPFAASSSRSRARAIAASSMGGNASVRAG